MRGSHVGPAARRSSRRRPCVQRGRRPRCCRVKGLDRVPFPGNLLSSSRLNDVVVAHRDDSALAASADAVSSAPSRKRKHPSAPAFSPRKRTAAAAARHHYHS
ncbi:uncharacterized protein AMSG_12357, partial [Thecamonas trahens ATCC 50062]